MLQVWRSEGSHVGTELRLLPAVPSSWSWSVCYYYYFCLIWDKDSCSQGWNWTVLQIWATTASPTSHQGLISGVLLAVCFPSCFRTVQGGSWSCQYNDIKWMDGCRLFFLFSIPTSCTLGLAPPSILPNLPVWLATVSSSGHWWLQIRQGGHASLPHKRPYDDFEAQPHKDLQPGGWP